MENNYFTEMCSGSEAGSYLRLIDFVYHPTLGLRAIKKKKTCHHEPILRLHPVLENLAHKNAPPPPRPA